MDIIYHIDYTDNTVTGGFCGVNDCSFHAHNNGTIGHTVSTFAIRFYAWSVYAFLNIPATMSLLSGIRKPRKVCDWSTTSLSVSTQS